MQVGIQFFPDIGPAQKSARDYWQEALQLVALCDRYGYSHVRTVEHYFHPYGGYSPNPVVFLAAAAQVTKQARLVTGAVLPAFNHPLKLAGELAMLDALCDGRLDIGFARAFLHRTNSLASACRSTKAALASTRAWSKCGCCWMSRMRATRGGFIVFECPARRCPARRSGRVRRSLWPRWQRRNRSSARVLPGTASWPSRWPAAPWRSCSDYIASLGPAPATPDAARSDAGFPPVLPSRPG